VNGALCVTVLLLVASSMVTSLPVTRRMIQTVRRLPTSIARTPTCCISFKTFAPNPILKFTVRPLQTASPADNRIVFSRKELRRRKPRHSLHRVALGLCTEAKNWHKEHALSNHAKSQTFESGQRLARNVGNPCHTRFGTRPGTSCPLLILGIMLTLCCPG
jgi:hypothetical protein